MEKKLILILLQVELNDLQGDLCHLIMYLHFGENYCEISIAIVI